MVGREGEGEREWGGRERGREEERQRGMGGGREGEGERRGGGRREVCKEEQKEWDQNSTVLEFIHVHF